MNLIIILEKMEGVNPYKEKSDTVFNYKVRPRMKIGDYASRLCKYIINEKSLIPFVLYYMAIYSNKSGYIINRYNIHRILLSSFVVTHKFWDDDSYDNKTLAKICGISLKELNKLEYTFLESIDWRLYRLETALIKEEMDEILDILINNHY